MLINKNTPIIVQGVGAQGRFHLKSMLDYGTNIVGAISKTKTGRIYNIPIYGNIKDALKKTKAEYSIIFVPAKYAKEAAVEALENNLNIIIITEGILVHDTIEILQLAKKKNKIVIGPNCPGIIAPDASKIGVMPSHIFKKGSTAIISRSGTLTYEIANELTKAGIGQSIVVGIGGDRLVGLDFADLLKLLEKDSNTNSIVLIGEIGGNLEEKAAEYILKARYKKKIVAYIAGKTSPEGKKMGHAGAIIEGSAGTAESKIKALQKAGIKVAELPSEVAKLLIKE